MTKLRLEILSVKKDKTIGNEYIHEVEISNAVYKKKFGGRIDVIIDNLKFSEKNQAFYISWFTLFYLKSHEFLSVKRRD